ncbi:DNA gyrase inhibitor YacG [Alphaproteobacteria bacterium]|jgi:endogenous inhibitor of DNA gyrase (YacG/DUF329 family)|nr:DNA gyrase inhibitor YacG [Alphaproteobacteria bacterium]|tara:strand:- start:162 stop:350 length:189 start_codon:yes stop_codon:yes gene_type:complete
MKNIKNKQIKCPICKNYFNKDLKTNPFCSQRCSHIDLGNWLGEKYKIAFENDDYDNQYDIDK